MLDHEDARALVRQGQEAGFLTHEEIALALGDDFEPIQLDEFYTALEELHIEVVDEAGDAAELDLEPEAREVSTDALQLFLKDIGKVPLLTAAQERQQVRHGDDARDAPPVADNEATDRTPSHQVGRFSNRRRGRHGDDSLRHEIRDRSSLSHRRPRSPARVPIRQNSHDPGPFGDDQVMDPMKPHDLPGVFGGGCGGDLLDGFRHHILHAHHDCSSLDPAPAQFGRHQPSKHRTDHGAAGTSVRETPIAFLSGSGIFRESGDFLAPETLPGLLSTLLAVIWTISPCESGGTTVARRVA
jgi:hypothetical protein